MVLKKYIHSQNVHHKKRLIKNKYIKYNSFVLLLIYTISIFPVALFHHHDDDIFIALKNTTQCEKTVYHSANAKDCGHKQHLSQTKEKCLLCHHNSNLLYTFSFLTLNFFTASHSSKFANLCHSFLFNFNYFFFNKGPPCV